MPRARARRVARRRRRGVVERRYRAGSPSSAASWIRTGRCSRRCSGSPCCPDPRAPCSIARPRSSRQEWRGEAKGADTTPIAQSRAVFGRPARALLWLLDWIPARLTALSFAIVGDFEDAAFCWRTQATTWADEEGGEHAGIVLASGAGALGMQVGGSIPTVGGEPDVRPELGLGGQAGSRSPAERGRARLACAGAVAAADAPAHARELGAVAGCTLRL